MNNPSQSENPDPYSTQHQFLQFQNPISFDHQNNPQTLEISTTQNPKIPDPTLLVADQEEDEEKELSGMVQESATKLPNRRNFSKRKKAVVYKKQLAIDKKVQNLLQFGTLTPFVPLKRFDFDMHEVLIKRIGLWDFVHIEFDEVIRDDLVGQFIVSYDHAKKCCFVNGFRISVNRTRFGTALKLPVKKDKAVSNVAEAVIDLEVDQVSEECVEFVQDFVWSWMVLRGSDWATPNEVKGWMGLIRDGNLDKVDWASLIWVMVENELKQRDQLRMCYYASHLQYFIKSQRKDLFEEESEDVAVNEAMKEEKKAFGEEEINEVKVEEIKKHEDLLLEEAEKVDEKEVMDATDLLRERPREVDEKEVKKGLHEAEVEEVKEGPHEEAVEVEGVKKDVVGSFNDLGKDPDKFVIEEPNTGLTLGQQVIVRKEDVKDDTRMAGEECPEKKYNRQFYFGHDTEGKHFLKPCLFRGGGFNGKEEIKQEVGQLETKEEEHMEEGERIQEWEHMEELEGGEMGEQLEVEDEEEEELEDELEGDEMGEQLEVEDEEEEELEDELEGDEMGEQLEVEDEEEEELEDELEGDEMGEQLEVEDEEELEDGIDCNVTPNYGSVERAGLTGNLLEGFETTHLPLNLQGEQLENSSMAPFASNVEKQVMMGRPSMFGNGHKRVFDYEQDTLHLDGSKRIRTDVGCDQNTSDFRSCVDQARQYMEKAKLIYEKGQAYNQVNVGQQYLLQELQRRDSVIENLQRNKNEELQKKDREIYRLERELDLIGELVNGYREALKVNRNMFFEYRQRCKLPEEPIYKDAGSGGLVLSTADLEKQRQQQENEDRLKRLMIEQKYNEALEGYVTQFQVLFRKVQMIDVNRLTPVVNEVKLLKELYAARHRAPEIPDCVPPESTLPSA